MFICRAQLLRATNPIRVVPSLTIRRIIPSARHYAAFNILDKLYKHGPSAGATVQNNPTSQSHMRSEDQTLPSLDLLHIHRDGSKESTSSKLHNSTSKPPETNEAPEFPRPDKAYLRMRQDPKSFLQIEPTSLIPMIGGLRFPEYSHIVDQLVMDVAKTYAPCNPDRCLGLISIIFRVLMVYYRVLTKEQICTLLRVLYNTGQVKRLQDNLRVPIARSLLTLQKEPIDVDTIELLIPMLVDSISECEPTKEDSVRVVWPLYYITQRLVILGQYQKALNVFHVLVQTQNVITSSITPTDLAEQDFAAVVTTSLIRSCVDWGWIVRANVLLREVIDYSRTTTGVVSPVYRKLASQLVVPLATIAAEPDIAGAAKLIRLLMDHGDLDVGPPYKRSILSRFYYQAHLMDNLKSAEEIYAYSQQEEIAAKAKRRYPAPYREAIRWLLHGLCTKSHNTALARTLVQQIVDENLSIPAYDRAPIVGLAASEGFAGPARILWERFVQAPPYQRRLLLGNASAMLRLVSVFSSLARRKGSVSRDKEVLGAYPWLKQTKPRRKDSTRKQLESVPPEQSSPVSADESVTASDAVQAQPPTESDASNPCDNVAGAEAAKDSAEDMLAFANSVVAAFRKTLIPLDQASHESLSALARAYFMLGAHKEGFAIFRFMVDRHIILDLHDMNIIIAALAHHDPANAMLMLERMVHRNLRPDAVSFGTVIHYAILHGNRELVSTAIARAKELGVNSFTFKTLGALLHATAKSQLTVKGNAADNLEGVKDIIREMFAANYKPTPEMGRDAVMAAINADSPRTAFDFWKMLVKGRSEWNDTAQKKLRTQIANRLREHYQRGWLEHDIGQSMLVQLEEGSLTRRLYGQGQRGEAVMSDSDTSPGAQGERESK